MSDFDKEAERERLREKYEKEEAKREATEQMSELLLKGATMTNAHCSDCGDPIFRYDGQEFCPTCQKPVDRDQGGQGAAEPVDEESAAAETGEPDDEPVDADGAPDEQSPADDEHIEVTTPSDEARVQFGSGASDAGHEYEGPDDAADAADQSDAQSRSPSTAQGPRQGDRRQRSPDVGPDAVEHTPSGGVGPTPPTSGEASPSVGSGQPSSATAADRTDAGEAASSVSEHRRRANVLLAQTVERFARRAREADSPREAREHLQAAREAADALEANGF